VTALVLARLEALVLARLETAGKQPIGPAALMKALRPFAPPQLTDAEWRQALDGAIEALRAAGAIDERWRAQAGELVRRIGRHTARTWKQLAERVLPALALGLGADDAKGQARLVGRDGWAAAIVGRALGVWKAGPPPSASAAMDALVWQELGLPGTPKQCPDELRAHFLHRHLGGEPGPAARLLRMVAVQAVDAPRADLNALRGGLVRMWLAGRAVGAAAPPTRPPDAAPPRSLAADVQAAAAAAREGVFGPRKVFISAIWDALRASPAWAALGLDELKARLVEAHRRGELVLARADLVAAMDPALVAASETRTDGATYHFVVREPSP
jgi:hypothetical protein